MQKYCQQAGALPQAATLRTTYVPRLFEAHFSALLDLLRDKSVSIIADETTGVRDHSILNVIATVKGKPYLIGVVEMEACNHSTYSQAIISCASEAGISFQNVTSIVSDSASYCKKAYRDVLSSVYPKSVHILCLAHIVNLAAEIFNNHKDFSHTANLITMIVITFQKAWQKESTPEGHE